MSRTWKSRDSSRSSWLRFVPVKSTHANYRNEKNKPNKVPSAAEEEPKPLQTTGKGEMVSREQSMLQRRNTWINRASVFPPRATAELG